MQREKAQVDGLSFYRKHENQSRLDEIISVILNKRGDSFNGPCISDILLLQIILYIFPVTGISVGLSFYLLITTDYYAFLPCS